mmetsp:Transcript_107288/g.308657  ORF Transcript_107288/g.308657 Transcript_107288/m.308657 type:complete len:156 (-) Transcript_107288:135-602(-)
MAPTGDGGSDAGSDGGESTNSSDSMPMTCMWANGHLQQGETPASMRTATAVGRLLEAGRLRASATAAAMAATTVSDIALEEEPEEDSEEPCGSDAAPLLAGGGTNGPGSSAGPQTSSGFAAAGGVGASRIAPGNARLVHTDTSRRVCASKGCSLQ